MYEARLALGTQNKNNHTLVCKHIKTQLFPLTTLNPNKILRGVPLYEAGMGLGRPVAPSTSEKTNRHFYKERQNGLCDVKPAHRSIPMGVTAFWINLQDCRALHYKGVVGIGVGRCAGLEPQLLLVTVERTLSTWR